MERYKKELDAFHGTQNRFAITVRMRHAWRWCRRRRCRIYPKQNTPNGKATNVGLKLYVAASAEVAAKNEVCLWTPLHRRRVGTRMASVTRWMARF